MPCTVGDPGEPGEDKLPGSLLTLSERGVAQGAQSCLLGEVPGTLDEGGLSNM